MSEDSKSDYLEEINSILNDYVNKYMLCSDSLLDLILMLSEWNGIVSTKYWETVFNDSTEVN
jgi:hypothetical protein